MHCTGLFFKRPAVREFASLVVHLIHGSTKEVNPFVEVLWLEALYSSPGLSTTSVTPNTCS
jgi:hypothetical protein